MTAKEKLTALADAVREKTGETGLLSLDAMTSLISSLAGGGGDSLPNGWATGSFNTTPQTIKGDFEIEHGLGAVPNIIAVFCDNTNLAPYLVKGLFRLNFDDEYVEEEGLYYPTMTAGRTFYINSTGSTITSATDAGAGFDTDKTFYVPSITTNTMYVPAFTYRWIAIRLEQ
jgi:hypothetical protein